MSALATAFGRLADAPRWVAWREESRGGKATKVPYSAVTGRRASSADPGTWATLEEVLAFVERAGMAGPGIVLGNGLGGIDLDGCRDPETGELRGWARKIVGGFRTYTEVSPSGTGVKLLAWGAPESLPASEIPMDTPPINGKRPAVEAFVGGRYFTVTGDLLGGCPDEIRDCGDVGDAWDRLVRFLREHTGEPSNNGDRGAPAGEGLPDDVDGMLAALDADCSHGEWLRVGMALHHADPEGGLELWDRWSATAPSRYPGPEEIRRRWASFAADRERAVTVGTLRHLAMERGYRPPARKEGEGSDSPVTGVTLADFRAYMPEHKYIFIPSRELWPASSVDARIPPVKEGKDTTKASKWLDREQPAEQMTWAPGLPMLIRDRLISHGGWIDREGMTCFNLYRPPVIEPGDPGKADPWLEHVQRVYDEATAHLVPYLAHRVQRPGEKINHALVLGGLQGIGKDTLLEPVKYGVGPWNFMEVAPPHLLGRFNGFVKSVILRVSEARDLGDVDRYGFYDHLKAYTAAPPDVLRVDEKHLREVSVPNVMAVIITTNHKSDGIYLPADDRRHYVAWSERTKDDFTDRYWTQLWKWYAEGGTRHVVAYLQEYDLSGFDPKAPPPKTSAFWDIVDANRAPEDAELADALDRLRSPSAVTLSELADAADASFGEWLRDRRNSRQIPHRMESAGYVAVRNDAAKDGKWKVGGRRQVIYAPRHLSVRDRMEAARALVEEGR